MTLAIDRSQRASSSSLSATSLHHSHQPALRPSIRLVPPPNEARTADTAARVHMSGSSEPILHARTGHPHRAARQAPALPSSQSLPALSAYAAEGHNDQARMDRRSHSSQTPLYHPHALAKGKERSVSGSVSSNDQQARGQWIFDLEEAILGAETWAQRDRVILVTGSPTPESLSPILLDPAFSSTHILIGVSQLTPEIDRLASSASIVVNGALRAVYPSMQVFVVDPAASSSAAHVLPTILDQAVFLARAHRAAVGSSTGTPRRASHSRRESDSSNSITPPMTPPPRARKLSNFGMKLERVSTDSSRQSRPSMTKSRSDIGLSGTLDRPSPRSRLSSFTRQSVLGGLTGSGTAEARANSGSPFDAVLNFIPPHTDFAHKAEMQGMLHQAVVLTTGVLPVLTQNPSQSFDPLFNPAVVPLVHVLPSTVPAPLPGVIESFLLNLMPTFAGRTDRDVFAVVITPAVWHQYTIDPSHSLTGASTLLFGGARCPEAIFASRGMKSRALLSAWRDCVTMPGLMAESRVPRTPGSPLSPSRTRSNPPSLAYSSVPARSPPQTAPGPLGPAAEIPTGAPSQDPSTASPGRSLGPKQRMNSRLRDLAFSDLALTEPPPVLAPAQTPELDPSPSSCSSFSGFPETGSEASASVSAHESRYGSQSGYSDRQHSPEGAPTISPLALAAEKDKTGWKAVGGWFKRKARDAS